eukprot:9249554-Lingulodinium_polyedra.AAC.1
MAGTTRRRALFPRVTCSSRRPRRFRPRRASGLRWHFRARLQGPRPSRASGLSQRPRPRFCSSRA